MWKMLASKQLSNKFAKLVIDDEVFTRIENMRYKVDIMADCVVVENDKYELWVLGTGQVRIKTKVPLKKMNRKIFDLSKEW